MKSYYKRYLVIAIPYTLAIWCTFNFVPVMVDIPILLALVASMPVIMKRFLVPTLSKESIGVWTCMACGNHTKKSPCPKCNSTQFKIA